MARRLGALCCCLLALPALAASQSLGEAAKKERERREKLRQGGSSAPSVDGDQLASNKGALANDTKQAPAAQGDQPPARGGKRPGTTGADASASGEAYWRSRAAAARRRVEEAEWRVDAFDHMIRFGQPVRYENGRRVIYSQQQMKSMADAAGEELKAARAAFESLLDEARRAGALPGWLR